VPATVTVAANSSSVTTNVTSSTVAAPTIATIQASYGTTINAGMVPGLQLSLISSMEWGQIFNRGVSRQARDWEQSSETGVVGAAIDCLRDG
jgi:hypothetical protein